MTTFENKCAILAELWIDFRYEEQFVDFISYNDLGLPLAYAIDSGIVEPTDKAISFIDETFDNLVSSMGIAEDIGFESIGDMFGQAEGDNA
jgi:hypothetical protein